MLIFTQQVNTRSSAGKFGGVQSFSTVKNHPTIEKILRN